MAKHYDFPFLFGGTFIEADQLRQWASLLAAFPSFSEGLSLRHEFLTPSTVRKKFPFLFGGTFIEAGCLFSRGGCNDVSLPFRRDFH